MFVPVWKCFVERPVNYRYEIKECLGARLRELHAIFSSGVTRGKRNAVDVEATMSPVTLGQTTRAALSFGDILEVLEVEELHVEGAGWLGTRVTHIWCLPRLRSLSLPHNALRSLPRDWFGGVPKLERLNLSHNNLAELPVGISSLKNLKYLDISHNPMRFLGSSLNEELQTLYKLEVLILSGTYLNELNGIRVLLETSSKKIRPSLLLKHLDISNCNVSYIREDEVTMLKYQYIISIVNMSYNKLQFIPKELFASLDNLKILDLSHNHLIEDPVFYFETSYLTNLDLSWNKLSFPGRIEKGKIKHLNVSHNEIKNWEYAMISPRENQSSLAHVNLSFNFIETFSQAMLHDFSLLKSIDLGENPIHCEDCKMEYLKQWLISNNTTLVYNIGSLSQLHCSYPTSLNRQIILNTDDCNMTPKVKVFAVFIVAFLSTAVAFVLLILLILCFGKRYELIYALHLLRIKKRWKKSRRGQYEYDAFIIHCDGDSAWVESELLPPLEAYGSRLCLLQRDFPLGSSSLDNFAAAMRASGCVVVVLSQCFLGSQWGLWQLEQAARLVQHRGLVLLARSHFQRSAAPWTLRFLIDTRTYLEWPNVGAPGQALRRLTVALNAPPHACRDR